MSITDEISILLGLAKDQCGRCASFRACPNRCLRAIDFANDEEYKTGSPEDVSRRWIEVYRYTGFSCGLFRAKP